MLGCSRSFAVYIEATFHGYFPTEKMGRSKGNRVHNGKTEIKPQTVIIVVDTLVPTSPAYCSAFISTNNSVGIYMSKYNQIISHKQPPLDATLPRITVPLAKVTLLSPRRQPPKRPASFSRQSISFSAIPSPTSHPNTCRRV